MLTKDEAVAELAEAHYSMDNGIRAIYRLLGDNEDDAQEPINLQQIDEDTLPAGIIPLFFRARPAKNVFYSNVVVVITPDEFAALQNGTLALSDGWRRDALLPRPSRVLEAAA